MGNANKALVKKTKEETLSWKWCIQCIETLKSNFFYLKLIISIFVSLTSALRELVSKTLILYLKSII